MPPRLEVVPARFTLLASALSAALVGPVVRLLLEEPHPELLVEGAVEVDRLELPQPLDELLPPHPPELREELNEERPPEKPPPPPRAMISPVGQMIASEKRNAARIRTIERDGRDISRCGKELNDW